MKILFTITYFSPYISGLTIYVKRLAERLKIEGYKPTILTMQHSRDLPTEENRRGVKIIRAKTLFAVSKGFISLKFIQLAWRLVKENDIVVVNLPEFEGIIPAIFAKLHQKKLVVIYHCEVKLPGGFINEITQSLLEISNYLSLVLAHQIVTYTKDYADNCRLLASFKKKIKYVYPPVPDLRVDEKLKGRLAAKIGKTTLVVGVAARLASEKGFEYLFSAIPWVAKKIKNFKIVIAGPQAPVGESAYRQKISRLISKYAKHLVFLGSLKEEQMGAFYANLDLLVLPSVNSTEAFGMVQVEAMKLGIPVVASDLPGVRIPIRKTGMGIIVEPKNSRAIAGAIIEIMNNKAKYIKEPEFIQKEFAIEKTIRFYKKLFNI